MEKLGTWEAPCREILIFGGKCEQLEGNLANFVHENI